MSHAPPPSLLPSLLRRTRSPSHARLLHNHLVQRSHDRTTFIRNCLLEMYGNCGCVADARTVFDSIPHPNIYSWNLMLRAYAHNGDIRCARSFFDLTPNPDVYTWNILFKAYIQNGELEDARRVFDRMPCHNVVSWTAMIAVLAHEGYAEEALLVFYRMHVHPACPDRLTFLRALDACTGLLALVNGQEIHSAIVEQSFDTHVVVGTALICMYGKCKCLLHAKAVFARMTNKDIVCWTAFMTACIQNEQYEAALHVFFQMHRLSLEPDNFTFACAIDACTGLTSLQEGNKIHSAIVEANIEQDFMMGTALVNFYGKCGSILDARTVFDRITSRDVVSWNAMMSILIDAGHSEDALHLFWRMHIHAVKPDQITFVCVLHACSNLTFMEGGQEIHTAIVEYCQEHDLVLLNSLINMYGKCSTLHDAMSIFCSMNCRDAITYNVLISVYISNDLAEEILDVFCQMQQKLINPDSITFTYVIDACGTEADFRKGQVIHGNIVENGYDIDPMVNSALVKMYGKAKSIDDARHVFDKMPSVDIVSWTAMVGASVDNGCYDEALDLFCRMRWKGIQPDSTSFVCALEACANLAALDKGEEIHAEVTDKGYDGDVMVRNALINMYGKCGNLHKAERLFSGTFQQSVASWNALVAAFSHNGHGFEAVRYFYKMVSEGIQPDEITFVTVLTACSHAGWIDDGYQYFILMKTNFGVIYTDDHYVCMIDLLGRAGQLEAAQFMIDELSVEKADVAWLCLLGACRIHNDFERGLYAAERLFMLNPSNATPYVMLANISAAAKKWDTVALYRKNLVHWSSP